MSDPVRFLTSMAQALSTMALYKDGHPARQRAIGAAYGRLRDLVTGDHDVQFSFLGEEVVFGNAPVRELKDWDWARRLTNAGVQRLEFARDVDEGEFGEFLDTVLARLSPHTGTPDSSEARTEQVRGIRFGAVGLRGESTAPSRELQTATLAFARGQSSLSDEADAVRWVHDEVRVTGMLPLLEAEAVVRSLSVAMHADRDMMLPLLQIKEFDEYTTTHSLNVAVLTMALAEALGLSGRDVRAYGVAGLLHDLGKVRIPRDILTKPGKLTDSERHLMQRHPVDGARLIFESDKQLDLAAVVAYEHHIMINGQGYPATHYRRDCHRASMLVHVCDVYDALRTNRPYRDAWESKKVLAYVTERAGVEFEAAIATTFVSMMQKWEAKHEG
ncbi:MAG: HD domain-containing protein [Gemmatimonadaceae bacterium]